MFTHSPRIVTDGLVLYLDAGNTKSYTGNGTVWKDLSGNGNDGTLINGVGYSNSNGGSLTFDGSNDYFVSGNNLGITGNNSWTVSFLIKVSSSENGSGRQGWILWVGSSRQSPDRLLSVGVNNGAIEVAHWANDTRFANSEIFFDNWQKIDITFNESTEVVYINAKQTNTKSTTLSLTDGKVYLGSRTGVEEFLNCQISSVKIYNRALTSQEILQNYKATKGRFGL